MKQVGSASTGGGEQRAGSLRRSRLFELQAMAAMREANSIQGEAGIMDGSQKPDYASRGTRTLGARAAMAHAATLRCVSIVTRAALREMVAPGQMPRCQRSRTRVRGRRKPLSFRVCVCVAMF